MQFLSVQVQIKSKYDCLYISLMFKLRFFNIIFNKVGYSTESLSTGVDRLDSRNQTNCYSKN